MYPSRKRVLGGLLVAFGVLSVFALVEVLETVVFAVTVVYVLYPLRRRLVDRGASRSLASALVTSVAFVSILVAVIPVGYVVYRRRADVVGLLRTLPAHLTLSFGGFSYTVATDPILTAARQSLAGVAVGAARAMPVLALKLLLFALLVYGMLYRPDAAREVVFGVVPPRYHDVLQALHVRTRDTLFAIYGLQAATALGTSLVALPVFFFLGYDSAFTLAVIAGVLQFVPVVGPAFLVAALALGDLLAGNPARAAMVLIFGLSLVGFLPDAVIRPRLAGYTTGLPVSLYFVGFVGGVLSLGAIGFVIGPLVVGLLVESVELVSAEVDAEPPV